TSGIQFVPVNHGNPLRPTHPQIAVPILQQLEHAVARQALRGCVVRELSSAPAIESASSRSEPQAAVGVFMHGPHLFVLERVSCTVGNKSVAMNVAHAAVGTNPDITVPVLQKGTG